jgi:Spx/MgsR family transcriptional regulator
MAVILPCFDLFDGWRTGDLRMLTVYGIPNCGTVKKARAWLDAQGLPHVFHDYKKQGVPADRLEAWMQAVGWDALINRQGSTWRQLDDAIKQSVADETSAKALMQRHASLIKRPIFERNERFLCLGFGPEVGPILTLTL